MLPENEEEGIGPDLVNHARPIGVPLAFAASPA